MSSIHNRIVTTFSANAGNALAVMGQLEGSILGVGRAGARSGSQAGLAEQQWRAFGTTLRYALAGTAIFAAPAMIRNLNQFQQQLGLISAIGQGPGGLPIVGAQLQALGTQAADGAVRAITPVTDFNNAVVNFLSTVQNVPPDQVTPIVTDIAQAARLAQIPVEDATKAFTTMSIAFGETPDKNKIHTTAQQFFALTKLAPGGVSAGGQIVGQLGQLAQVTRLAGGNEGNLFGLLLSGLRTGIPPSQLGRGLQFLIQTVGLPGQQTKESEQALGSVGIRAGQRMPLTERLNRIFTHARKLSGGNIPNLDRVANLDEDTLNQLDASGNMNSALKDLGITGPGATFLGQIFHRVHALRTALALLGQFNQGKLQEDLKRASEIQKGHVDDINNLSKQWKNFEDNAQLAKAGVALQRMGIQVARTFQPIFNIAARGITGASEAAANHPDATRDAIWGAGGLAALLGARKLLTGRGVGIGSLFRRAPGIGVGVAAGQDLLSGQIPTGKPSDPVFVVVLAQLGGKGVPIRGGGSVLTPGESGGGGRKIPFLGLGVGAGLAGGAAIAAILATPNAGGAISHDRRSFLQRHYPSLFAVGVRRTGLNENMDERAMVPGPHTPKWITDILQNHSVGVANRLIRDRMTRIYTNMGGASGANASEIALAVKGRVTLDIDYNTPSGAIKTKKVHVRVDNWDNGNKPQHRGRPNTKKR